MQAKPNGSGIGEPVRRREDLRLVTGKGRYSDDLNLPGQAYTVFVRSPHARPLHPRARYHRRQSRARRAGGADRRRGPRGRAQPAAA